MRYVATCAFTFREGIMNIVALKFRFIMTGVTKIREAFFQKDAFFLTGMFFVWDDVMTYEAAERKCWVLLSVWRNHVLMAW
jgi:hypothetical protein